MSRKVEGGKKFFLSTAASKRYTERERAAVESHTSVLEIGQTEEWRSERRQLFIIMSTIILRMWVDFQTFFISTHSPSVHSTLLVVVRLQLSFSSFFGSDHSTWHPAKLHKNFSSNASIESVWHSRKSSSHTCWVGVCGKAQNFIVQLLLSIKGFFFAVSSLN